MPRELRNLIAICGLYCGDCPHYLAPRLGDAATLEALARAAGCGVEQAACDGCLSERPALACRECRHGFRACAAAHDVTWCSECPEFPCLRLEAFRKVHVQDGVSHHEKVVEDLHRLCVGGARAWLARKAEQSRCPGCGQALYWYARACPGCGAPIPGRA
jgi:hypothetical protein